MTDLSSTPAGRPEEAAERAAREEKHALLIELLGAYADGELPPETVSQIDAHLVGCARCRRDLAVHHAVRHRLGVEPPIAAPPALRERIAAAVAAAPLPEPPAPAARPRRRTPLLVAAAVLLAVVAGSAVVVRERAAAPAVSRLAEPAAVPLVREAVADYRRATAGDLPGRARDLDLVRGAVPFPVEPLRAPGLRLLAAWTTVLGGEPAAVLAYRWNDEVVLQYLVSDDRFFQHPAVRRAVGSGRLLVATDGAQGVVAWPTRAGGTLLVGDLPAERLARELAAPLVRAAARGAQ